MISLLRNNKKKGKRVGLSVFCCNFAAKYAMYVENRRIGRETNSGAAVGRRRQQCGGV
jgi:hypothetical protein